MNDDRWNNLVAEVRGDDIERMVEASQSLYNECDIRDVPRLLDLLKDEEFVVREAAAWPLSSVGGPEVLLELFTAYQKGFDEGHDNDGFTAALIELVELHPKTARAKLLQLKEAENTNWQIYSDWLLQFC